MLVEPMGIEPLTASTDFPRIFRFVTLPPSIVWVVVVASGHNLATEQLRAFGETLHYLVHKDPDAFAVR